MRTLSRRLLVTVALSYALMRGALPASAVPQVDVAGGTPALTAIALSQSSFPNGAESVVIAEQGSWQAQLTGAGLAGALEAPLLLSIDETVSAPLAMELRRLGALKAYVLAPDSSRELATSVASLLSDSAAVVAINASDAQESARTVAGIIAQKRPVAPTSAVVLNANSWPGAISAAALAGAGWPVLFADSARPSANANALIDLGIERAVVCGGPSAALDAEARSLAAALGTTNVTRVSAPDRYTLARTVARSVAASAGLGFSAPVIVSGASGPDEAVLAGTLAARRQSVLLLAGAGGIGDTVAGDLFARRATVTSLAFVGPTTALPKRHRVEVQQALRAPVFSAKRAMKHVKYLAGLGPRKAGGKAERKAVAYVGARLAEYGYTVRYQDFAIPGGKTSRNVIAEKRGSSSDVIVLGGHLDSKYPSPGGNDNASGVAATLELARCLAQAEGLAPTVRFIGFGAEEMSGKRSTDHHFGSRYYVKTLSKRKLAAIEGMLSIDMVGYGKTFTVRNLKKAPQTTRRSVQSWGTFTGQRLVFLKDPSADGWSDHEAFEFKGIPVAWLEWRDDPVYHTKRDTYRHVSADRVKRTGRLVRGWILGLTPAKVDALKP